MVKTYSTTTVSLSCRVKSPIFSIGVGVGTLDICFEGSPLSGLSLPSGFAKFRKNLRILMW